ncbi:MAG: transporter [Sphingomonadales bacterium]|nr:transporter [Sphingomonadales bacterium]
MTNRILCNLLASAAALCATPAFADHGAAGTGPETAGPIVGASARTLAPGKLAFGFDLALAKPDNRDDATLAALAGQHVHAHDMDRGEIYTLSAAYGVTENLTLSASLPYVRRIAIREGEHGHVGGAAVNDVVMRGNSEGFGDAALVAKWRFTGENHHGWEAALLAGLKLPTGTTERLDASGERFETEHQPGTGSWDPLVGMALTRSLPRGSFNASATYQLSTRGSQDTEMGDRAQFALGFSHRLVGGAVAYHHHGDEDAHKGGATLDGVLELNGEWEGMQRVAGARDATSGGKALYLSPGLRLSASGWSFTLGGSIPLAQEIRASHSDTRYRLRLGVGRAF